MSPSSASSTRLPPLPDPRAVAARLDELRDLAWFAPTAVGAGWLLLGALAGLQAAFLDGPGSWDRGPLPPLLAGALWVPLTFGAAWVARRSPWDRDRPARFLAVHLTAALAASFVLNGAFALVVLAAGSVDPAAAAELARTGAVRWLHLNAAGYGSVVLAVHLLDRRNPELPGPAWPDALEVASGAGQVRVPLDEIDWIEADGDYARVHASGRSWLLSERMKTLASRLAPAGFVRVHRSAIVNGARVREVRHRTHGDYDAVLRDGTVVRVSRGRREGLDPLFPRSGRGG